ADMHKAVAIADEIDEGAELHHLHDGTIIYMPDFGLRNDALDPFHRFFDGLEVGRGHLHGAVVLDVHLGARDFADLANHLATGADHFADLFLVDPEGLDPRRVGAQLLAGVR